MSLVSKILIQKTFVDLTFEGLTLSGGGRLVAKSCPTLVTPWTEALQAPVHGIFSVNILKCSCNTVLILRKYSYGFQLCGVQEQVLNTVNESDNCLESNLNVVILLSVCDTTLLKELTTNKQKSISLRKRARK